jgi:hypothetical protein
MIKKQRNKTYLSIISGSGGKQRMERVVRWDSESSGVDEELASDVEEDEEEVDGSETEDNVNLGDGSLALEIVKHWVLGELYMGEELDESHDEVRGGICIDVVEISRKEM